MKVFDVLTLNTQCLGLGLGCWESVKLRLYVTLGSSFSFAIVEA